MICRLLNEILGAGMANKEHLAILRQGVEEWNQWRKENPNLKPDLSNVELPQADLFGANLFGVNLIKANLFGANLIGTILIRVNLSQADLSRANLSRANLSQAILTQAYFRQSVFNRTILFEANLSRSILYEADVRGAYIEGANIKGADLSRADFSYTNLDNADFSNAQCGATIFVDIDLSSAKGLETVEHRGPSTIGTDTLFRSKGKIPEIFLRGCGVPESLITYLPSFMEQAIQFYSCFISYSHKDQDFARRLHDHLQGEGIRCWLDEHELNPGDPLHPTIYEAIRVYDKVLLCCSETALKSWWVEKEFGNAIQKEEDYRDVVLIPLNLDGYLFSPECEGWIPNEIKKRLAADFTGWKEHDGFEAAVSRVIKALRTDGGKLPPPEPKMKRKR